MEKSSINDIIESTIDSEVLEILLRDCTTNKNIIWATDDYSSKGEGYFFTDTIEIDLITGENEGIIKPRIEKNKDEQIQRSKDKAEVFTPSWVCNIQNNLVDKAYIGAKFNTEKYSVQKGHYWEYEGKSKEPAFPRKNGVTWQDYVESTRLEISCGEAPYITSRYDTITGKTIRVKSRIGLLDRKLRVINRYVDDYRTWLKWAKKALQSIYGFEWQGDNLLLARENVLYTVIEHYYDKYGRPLPKKSLLEYADIISWNVWQMDGIKCVVPETCHEIEEYEPSLFSGNADNLIVKFSPCPGCASNNKLNHNGTYCIITDWKDNGATKRFVDLMEGGNENGKI